MERIYIIEDDENIRNLLLIALEGFGYQAEAFETAEEGLEQIRKLPPDLVVLDWMLPGISGVAAMKSIRQTKGLQRLPIIMLTAKDKELDKVTGLDGGADDYMVKPFGVLELAARIRSLLRRSSQGQRLEETLFGGGISVCQKTREVTSGNRNVELTLKEYELLVYLMKNDFRVVPRKELLNQIWGYEYDGESRTLDMHIRTLRQKLGKEHGLVIKTIRGIGYRFMAEEKGVTGRG